MSSSMTNFRKWVSEYISVQETTMSQSRILTFFKGPCYAIAFSKWCKIETTIFTILLQYPSAQLGHVFSSENQTETRNMETYVSHMDGLDQGARLSSKQSDLPSLPKAAQQTIRLVRSSSFMYASLKDYEITTSL